MGYNIGFNIWVPYWVQYSVQYWVEYLVQYWVQYRLQYWDLIFSMCKLGELSKFLEYSGSMLEISSQFIWEIPVTYWKFPVGSKMILLFLDMLEAFKNSEKNRISLLYVTLPIWIIQPSIFKGFSELERIIMMVLCIFK